MKLRTGLFVLAILCAQVHTGSANASANVCTDSGENCSVGDIGPGGGIVFYDAGSMQSWGRFLEAKPYAVPADGVWGNSSLITKGVAANKQIGAGYFNSALMYLDGSTVMSRLWGSYFGLHANGGKASFYLPSKDELDALYNYWKISGDSRLNYPAAPIWTSSEASATFAWYQLFQDGTQFTDANGIIPKLAGNKNYLKSPVHVGSGFEQIPFQVIGVHPFPERQVITIPTSPVVSNPAQNETCSNGGAATACKIGDIGPGGGIVFYDAGKDEYWGRYLEIAPVQCEGIKIPWRPVGNTKTVYKSSGNQSAAELRVLAKGLGMGKVNTRVITIGLGAGVYAAKWAEDLNCGGVDDWFLPSKDELDMAYNRLAQNRIGGQDTPVGAFNKGYYWTSTDYNNTTAWTQYFMDGQQFDRVQTLSGNKQPPANPFRVRPIRAFGTNNVVKTCAEGGKCKVGDLGPGGGKVFYVAQDMILVNGKNWRYLEAAPTDSFGRPNLCGSTLACLNVKTGVKADWQIGKGIPNSAAILKMPGVGAVKAIITSGINGRTDWFIPSREEMKLLYASKIGVGGFVDDRYWTSSSATSMLQTVIDFEDGSESISPRNGQNNLRLIRAFG